MKAMKNTEQVIAKATAKVTSDMTNLSNRRDSALSAFRKARSEMQAVNEGTRQSLEQLASLKNFIESQVSAGEKMIADNEHVCAKITEIIGE